MKRISVVLFTSLFALSANGQGLTLKTLRAKLGTKKSSWVAGETKVSTLSRDDQKRLLGVSDMGHGDFFFNPAEKKASYGPSHFEWKDQGGVKYSSPILDQGRCGACVAFAAVGQLETQMNITRKTPDSPWAFSPQHLFSCGGGGCETGWQPWSALSYLESDGVPDEACFPYQSGAIGDDLSCKSTCSNAKDRAHKIARYTTVSFFFSSVASTKKALQKGPLLTTMTVYEDFMFYKGGVYEHTTGDQLGGHAVVLEGWDDADKAWIVRNSWGEDFGEGGYFRIKYSDKSGVGNMAWGIEVSDSGDGMVSLGSLRDRTILSSKAQPVQVESTFGDTKKVGWEMLNGAVKVADGTATRSGSLTVDTTAQPDGVYSMVAYAERASSTVRSQPREVYILNGKLTGKLSFNNVSAGEELKDKKILECSVTSAPVPFTHLIFRAKNLATGEMIERRTTNVAPKINLSFFTPRLPNGDYELSLEGVAGTQSIHADAVKVAIKN